MKPKPILFSTDMVQALLDGRKTQTRRIIKPQYAEKSDGTKIPINEFVKEFDLKHFAPYQPGDILWVRETWGVGGEGLTHYFVYRTDYGTTGDDSFPPTMFKWKPSIHMPYEAARIFLRVTKVRAERLQDIMNYPTGKNHPVVLEGFTYGCDFIAAWQSTMNKKDWPLYGWGANPWVFVYEFERCEKPQG